MRIFAAVVFVATLHAQNPVFEVASIKVSLSPPGNTSTGIDAGGTLRIKNYHLKRLITYAYEVFDFQVSGGPSWTSGEGYDIVAKPDRLESDPPQRYKQARIRLQALLADRFQLQVHRETRELPVYALVLAKGGAKMQENRDSTGGSMVTYSDRITGVRSSMQDLAKALSAELGRTVEDRTELTGIYDFKLSWTPDSASPETVAASDKPSLFTALQQQLGLRLESRKGPVEVIVIDRASKPSEN